MRRIDRPLLWKGGVPGQPRDGDSYSRVIAEDNVPTYFLKAQPDSKGRMQGVSHFVPATGLSEAVHRYLGLHSCGCSVISTSAVPPDGLDRLQDVDLRLKLNGGEVIPCGEHWTVFSRVALAAADFEDRYKAYTRAAAAEPRPSAAAAGAAARAPPPPSAAGVGAAAHAAACDAWCLEVDDEAEPSDPRAKVAVHALRQLASSSDCPNVRVFCLLFAGHIAAADLELEEVLSLPACPALLDAALPAFTVLDPYMEKAASALLAALGDTLGHPSSILWTPHWLNAPAASTISAATSGGTSASMVDGTLHSRQDTAAAALLR